MKKDYFNMFSVVKKLFIIQVLLSITHVVTAQNEIYGVPLRTPVNRSSTLNAIQNSLQTIDNKMNAANEEYSNLKKQLAEYREQLNDDEATLSWFSDFVDYIEADYESYTKKYDWGGAYNYCISKKGDLAIDPELRARIRTSKEYKEMQSGMGYQERLEWKMANPYCFIPITNDQGKIIGGKLGTPEELKEWKEKRARERRILE